MLRFTLSKNYNDYFDATQHKELMIYYHEHNIKQFHSCNAGIINVDGRIDFYSYYTRVCTVYYNHEYVDVTFYPIIYHNEFTCSRTTSKQFSKFMNEYVHADLTHKDIMKAYTDLCLNRYIPIFCTHMGKELHIAFSRRSVYLKKYGTAQTSAYIKTPIIGIINDTYFADWTANK